MENNDLEEIKALLHKIWARLNEMEEKIAKNTQRIIQKDKFVSVGKVNSLNRPSPR